MSNARAVCEEVLMDQAGPVRPFTSKIEERLARALLLALDGLTASKELLEADLDVYDTTVKTLASIEALFEEGS